MPEVSHGQLVQMLREKYAEPYWWFLHELRNDTGFNADRKADGIAFGIYGSKGRDIIGFEVKASRSDWLNELQKPEKAEAFSRYCDYWYLVTSNAEVAKPEELRDGWGLMTLRNGKLRAVKMPTRMITQPLDRGLFARILQQTIQVATWQTEQRLGAKDIKARIERERQEAAESARQMAADKVKTANDALEELQGYINQFEKDSGIRIDKYGYGAELGKVLRAIREGQDWVEQNLRSLDYHLQQLDRMSDEFRQVRDGLTKVREICAQKQHAA